MMGDIVRVTTWINNPMNPPGWALQIDEDDPIDVVFLLNPPADHSVGERLILERDIDQWEVVPADRWPDEVCAAFAKWRLTR